MRVLSALLLVGLVTVSSAFGEDASAGFEVVATSPIQIGEEITFRSKILSQEVSMSIHLPSGFEASSPDHTYPVIFLTGAHGYYFFSAVAGIAKHLGDRERIPESIVVSLNDMGEIPEVHTHGMWGREKLGGGGNPEPGLRHLKEEVFPFLEKNYRANDYRIIVGVSGSSLFPIYTFTHAPGLFDSHVLVAAADTVGMGYSEDSTFIDTFETLMTGPSKHRAKLYVGTADADVEKRPEYLANLDRLKARLGDLERLDLVVEVVEDADHYAVLIDSVQTALAQNFPPELWSARYRDLVAQPGDALANIDNYYRELSNRYGFQILPRADRWNNVNCLSFMIRHLIAEDRPKEALTVAKRRIEYRPRAAGSYAGLADALEALDRHDEAVKAQKKAVALARKVDNTWELPRQEERLKKLVASKESKE